VLILASASQSRKKLLENCQIEFIQISSDFDETTIQEKNIFNLALELSFQKANSLSENIQKISLPEEFNYGLWKYLGVIQFLNLKEKLMENHLIKKRHLLDGKKCLEILDFYILVIL